MKCNFISRAIVRVLLSILVIFGIRNLAVATPIPTGYAVLSNLTIEDPATIIHGDMRSNSQIQFSGNYFVYGVSLPTVGLLAWIPAESLELSMARPLS